MFNLRNQKNIGSIFMVAGTAIGAGMLALPLVTSEIGFYYAILVFVLSYLFMLTCSYLFAEATFYSEIKNTNIITLARERLGVIGQASAWIFFLLLLYAVAAAYISAGGGLMGKGLGMIFTETPVWVGIFIFILCFGFLAIFKMRVIDTINRFMLVGLIGAFIYLVFYITPYVDPSHFTIGKPAYIWATIPVIVLSFTSCIIVPSLKGYLGNSPKRLTRALWIGNLIPLVFYIIWQTMIMGVLPPVGENSLAMVEHSQYPLNTLTQTLQTYLGAAGIATAVAIFSFCALITSFLAVNLSLIDFLADGLRIEKNTRGKMILAAITIIPPLLFALFFPKGFLIAIGYAGVFVAILYGILPTLIVWKARYHENATGPIRVWGGKLMLIAILLGSILVILTQVGATLGWLTL